MDELEDMLMQHGIMKAVDETQLGRLPPNCDGLIYHQTHPALAGGAGLRHGIRDESEVGYEFAKTESIAEIKARTRN